MSPAEDVLALARRLATGPNLTNLNERLHLLLTATPDNVKRDNMSDQPITNECPRRGIGNHDCAEHDTHVHPPGSVRTVVIEDGVDSDLDLQVKILDAREVDPAFVDPILHLSFNTREHPGRIVVPASMLRRVLAEVDLVAALGPHDYSNPGGAGLVIDLDGRLEVQWTDRSAHVAITPDVVEGFVKQVNKLRADVAKWTARAEAAEEYAAELADWSNAIATRVPESYEGVDGTQEGCIGRWLDDLEQVAGPFLMELLEVADIPGGTADLGDLVVPLPADPTEQKHLFDAAARLGGE